MPLLLPLPEDSAELCEEGLVPVYSIYYTRDNYRTKCQPAQETIMILYVQLWVVI